MQSAYSSYSGHNGPCTCLQCTTQAHYVNQGNGQVSNNNTHLHIHQPYQPTQPQMQQPQQHQQSMTASQPSQNKSGCMPHQHQHVPHQVNNMTNMSALNPSFAPHPHYTPMYSCGGEGWMPSGAPHTHAGPPISQVGMMGQVGSCHNSGMSHVAGGGPMNANSEILHNQKYSPCPSISGFNSAYPQHENFPPRKYQQNRQQRNQLQDDLQAEVRVRFVNAKFMRHDPYSHNAYLIMGMPQPQTTERRGSTASAASAASAVSCSAPPSSPSQLSASSSTAFTEEATGTESRSVDSPTMRKEPSGEQCIARLPAQTGDDATMTKCRWMDVYEDTGSKMQKRRYRFSGTLPCGHRAYAKRLRYRRGWTYFMCVSCGFKWGESGAR